MVNLTSWGLPNTHHNLIFGGVLALESVVESCQHPATMLNVYDCGTESSFYHKLQCDWEKDHFGCKEEWQTRFQNICVYDSHSINAEPIYPFFNFANQF